MKTLNLKKFLACLMATLLLLTSFSISIATAETEGDFEYEIYTSYDADWNATNYIEITGYIGSASDITIPSEIEGLPVTSIGYGAFMNCTTLTSVTIPESVTCVYGWAFEDCTNLKAINLPDSLEHIGSGILSGTAFFDNAENWEDNLLYIGKYLLDAKYDIKGDVIVKEGTALIASYTFFLSDITSVKLPDSLLFINESAFSDCEKLTEITLPSKLKVISGNAFDSCISLTEVTVPASVKTVGYNAFANCTNLESLTLPEGIEQIPSDFVSNCTNLKSFTIPSTVKEIEFNAFEHSGLETINIPAGVEFIYSEAFSFCESLTSITVDSKNANYYTIDGALYEKSLYDLGDCLHTYPAGKIGTTYTLPETVNKIEGSAFAGAKNLKKVVLHKDAFGDNYIYAYSLEEVDVADSNEYCYDVDGVVFEKETNSLIYYPSGKKDSTYTVPADTTEIYPNAISFNNYLTEITVSEGVESMPYDAIIMCENLKTINLPSTLTDLDLYAIDACYGLETINFNGTKAQWDAFEAEVFTESDKGLYINCIDGTFELVAPDEPEEDPTEGDTGTTPPEFTEPTGTSPEGSTATDPTESTFDLGDVNMDKKLNIRDATAIQKHLAKISALSEEALAFADFTQDGKVNIKDATNIQKKIAGLI